MPDLHLFVKDFLCLLGDKGRSPYPKFYFQRIVINALKKATPKRVVHLQTGTNYLVCLFSIYYVSTFSHKIHLHAVEFSAISGSCAAGENFTVLV